MSMLQGICTNLHMSRFYWSPHPPEALFNFRLEDQAPEKRNPCIGMASINLGPVSEIWHYDGQSWMQERFSNGTTILRHVELIRNPWMPFACCYLPKTN